MMACYYINCTDPDCVLTDGSTHPTTNSQEGTTMSTITANPITILTRQQVRTHMFHVSDEGPGMFWWHTDLAEAEGTYHRPRHLLTASRAYYSGSERRVSNITQTQHAAPVEPVLQDRVGEYYRDDWVSTTLNSISYTTGHVVTTVEHIDGAVLSPDLFLYQHVDGEGSQWFLLCPTPPHPSATVVVDPLPQQLIDLGLWAYPVTDEQAEQAVAPSPEMAAHLEVERALATLRETMAERERFAAGVVKMARRAKHDYSWCGEVEGMLDDANVDAAWTTDMEITVTMSLRDVTGRIAQSETGLIGDVREALRSMVRQMLTESKQPGARWSGLLDRATLVSMDATGTVTERAEP